jgi:hypothetical protein
VGLDPGAQRQQDAALRKIGVKPEDITSNGETVRHSLDWHIAHTEDPSSFFMNGGRIAPLPDEPWQRRSSYRYGEPDVQQSGSGPNWAPDPSRTGDNVQHRERKPGIAVNLPKASCVMHPVTGACSCTRPTTCAHACHCNLPGGTITRDGRGGAQLRNESGNKAPGAKRTDAEYEQKLREKTLIGEENFDSNPQALRSTSPIRYDNRVHYDALADDDVVTGTVVAVRDNHGVARGRGPAKPVMYSARLMARGIGLHTAGALRKWIARGWFPDASNHQAGARRRWYTQAEYDAATRIALSEGLIGQARKRQVQKTEFTARVFAAFSELRAN